MDNKYNQLMNHIEVSDEMRARILQNISEMDIKSRTSGVTSFSAAKRAKVSRIIGIAAAAGIVLSVGGIILFKAADKSTKSADVSKAAYDPQYSAGGIIDREVGGYDDFIKGDTLGPDINSAACETAATGAQGIEDSADEFNFISINSAGAGKSKDSFAVRSISYKRNDGTVLIINDTDTVSEVLRKITSLQMVPTVDADVTGYEFILSGNGKSMSLVIGDGLVKIDGETYSATSADKKTIVSSIISLFEKTE